MGESSESHIPRIAVGCRVSGRSQECRVPDVERGLILCVQSEHLLAAIIERK